MTNLTFEEKFLNYLRASYSLLWVRSHEENRVSQCIVNATSTTNVPVYVYSWDSRRFLEKHDKAVAGAIGGTWGKVNTTTASSDFSYTNIIDSIRKMDSKGRNVFIIKDFHFYIETPGIIRQIRNALADLRAKGSMLIFVSPIFKIPVDLEKEIQILDFHLPNDNQLEATLTSVVAVYNKKQLEKGKPEEQITPDIKQAAIEAAKGLTASEAHDAYSLSIIENKKYNADFLLTVFEEKVKQVKKGGLLQYIKPDIKFDNIGGLDGLKKWIRARSKAYSSKARDYSLPYPKGVLLCGIPGCGKTALAKATANEFGFPLFQLDIGALFGKLVNF